MPRDYYEVLGTARDATDRDIRTSFRRLARKHHPDVNPGQQDAAERFKEINEAYEVLSDPESRRLYDRYGHSWRQARGMPDGQPGSGTFRWRTTGFGQEPFGDLFTAPGGMGDIFERFFGGAGGAPTRTRTRSRRQQVVEQPVDLSLEEAFTGTTRALQVTGQATCSRCAGSGMEGRAACPECLGQGFSFSPVKGQVTIPPGVDTGSRVRVAPGGQEVVLVVRVAPHPSFQRKGADISTEVPVPLYDALLGGEVVVPTLNGQVALTLPPEAQNGRVFRLSGQGMPHLGTPSVRGDLLVSIRVELPTGLTAEERDLLLRLRGVRRQGGVKA